MKHTTKIIAMFIILLIPSFVHADLFSDISISTDEDAYINININSTGDVNLSEEYNYNEYHNTIYESGYSEEKMFNDLADAFNHYTGYGEMSFVETAHKRFFNSISRLVIAIYDQVHSSYFKIMNQEVRAHAKSITKLEERIKQLEALHDIEPKSKVSVLCESLIEVMNEDNETNIVCKNGHGLETWHKMQIGDDTGAITLHIVN